MCKRCKKPRKSGNLQKLLHKSMSLIYGIHSVTLSNFLVNIYSLLNKKRILSESIAKQLEENTPCEKPHPPPFAISVPATPNPKEFPSQQNEIWTNIPTLPPITTHPRVQSLTKKTDTATSTVLHRSPSHGAKLLPPLEPEWKIPQVRMPSRRRRHSFGNL